MTDFKYVYKSIRIIICEDSLSNGNFLKSFLSQGAHTFL